MEDNVKFLGFVTQEGYQCCIKAPTIYANYLGPNNLPPLESMALGVGIWQILVVWLNNCQIQHYFDPKVGEPCECCCFYN